IAVNPKINIVGMHNIENILASVAASYCAGVKPAIIERVISNYKGVEHRIEFVKKITARIITTILNLQMSIQRESLWSLSAAIYCL
ncbi:MAG: hypothetical protein FWC88_02625, partial [Endomicrobia bacterium]|nr:hypothetical protein [Endomicrobiia bacterium]